MMTEAELRTYVRKLCNDHETANWSGMENVLIHEGNLIDGRNRHFYLLNRRIVPSSLHAYLGHDEILWATHDINTNAIVYPNPPALGSSPLVSYYWHFATDDEMDTIIREALDNANLMDVSSISISNRRVVVAFVRAFHALFVAQHAAEYYTISAAGKTVSKDAVFQHYQSLYTALYQSAMHLRDDFYKGQGTELRASQAAGGYDDIDEDWA